MRNFSLGKVSWEKSAVPLDFVQMRGGGGPCQNFWHLSRMFPKNMDMISSLQQILWRPCRNYNILLIYSVISTGQLVESRGSDFSKYSLEQRTWQYRGELWLAFWHIYNSWTENGTQPMKMLIQKTLRDEHGAFKKVIIFVTNTHFSLPTAGSNWLTSRGIQKRYVTNTGPLRKWS